MFAATLPDLGAWHVARGVLVETALVTGVAPVALDDGERLGSCDTRCCPDRLTPGRCGAACERRMQGTWNHDRAHYRCRFPNEYAIANRIDHPLAVYVREDAVLGPLDEWLAGVFAPDRVRQALTALVEQRTGDDHIVGEAERQLAECDRKLASHRAALEAGPTPVNPALIAAWTADVQRRRDAISARLQARSTPRSTRMRPAQIVDLVSALGGMLEVLRRAEADNKCDVYRQLGLSVVYRHEDRTSLAQVRPRIPVGVMDVSEGGLAH